MNLQQRRTTSQVWNDGFRLVYRLVGLGFRLSLVRNLPLLLLALALAALWLLGLPKLVGINPHLEPELLAEEVAWLEDVGPYEDYDYSEVVLHFTQLQPYNTSIDLQPGEPGVYTYHASSDFLQLFMVDERGLVNWVEPPNSPARERAHRLRENLNADNQLAFAWPNLLGAQAADDLAIYLGPTRLQLVWGHALLLGGVGLLMVLMLAQLNAVCYRLMVRLHTNPTTRLRHLTKSMPRWRGLGRAVWVVVVGYPLVALGLVLGVVPGLLIGGVLVLGGLAAYDEQTGLWAGIRRVRSLAKPQLGRLISVQLGVGLLAYGGWLLAMLVVSFLVVQSLFLLSMVLMPLLQVADLLSDGATTNGLGQGALDVLPLLGLLLLLVLGSWFISAKLAIQGVLYYSLKAEAEHQAAWAAYHANPPTPKEDLGHAPHNMD